MKLYEKISISLGSICMLVILWHVFTPESWQIEGFYGKPLYICSVFIGWALGIGLEKLNHFNK